jgi:hypothetical protein
VTSIMVVLAVVVRVAKSSQIIGATHAALTNILAGWR